MASDDQEEGLPVAGPPSSSATATAGPSDETQRTNAAIHTSRDADPFADLDDLPTIGLPPVSHDVSRQKATRRRRRRGSQRARPVTALERRRGSAARGRLLKVLLLDFTAGALERKVGAGLARVRERSDGPCHGLAQTTSTLSFDLYR